MSIVSRDKLESTVHSPQSTGEGQQGALSLGWVVFYLGCALTISWLYYHNPGLWKLVERARYWTQLVKAM